MLEFQHHCLARTELYVMAYHYVSARCDIHGFLGITDYLGITLYVEFGCNVSAVDDGHDALAVILTRHHVNAVLRAETGSGCLLLSRRCPDANAADGLSSRTYRSEPWCVPLP